MPRSVEHLEEKTQREGETPGRDQQTGLCVWQDVLQKDRRVSIQLRQLLWESRKGKENLLGLQWPLGRGSDEVGMGRLQGISVAKGERSLQYGLRRVL